MEKNGTSFGGFIGSTIFFSRWLQAPLYLGLIVAQAIYVWHFMAELKHLLFDLGSFNEEAIMLLVLGLVDVVMIANLLIMVIVGGYETFVSKLDLKGHRDQPEWLSSVNANLLKVKLAMAIVGISSIHLLKTFIAAGSTTNPPEGEMIMWQVLIHVTFVISAIALAYIDRIGVNSKMVEKQVKLMQAQSVGGAEPQSTIHPDQPHGQSHGHHIPVPHLHPQPNPQPVQG